MESQRPIVILGFGRSGTTWLSDIISKKLGKLILFEPCHPKVNEHSFKLSYSTVLASDESSWLKGFCDRLLRKEIRNPWLLRNHLPHGSVDSLYVENIWNETGIAGFKFIRANFLIDWFINVMGAKIVYVRRNPFDVISSIIRRNFWEFGWPDTYDLFISKALKYRDSGGKIVDSKNYILNIKDDYITQIAIMWSLTHIISTEMLSRHNLPVFNYDDIYRAPFAAIRELYAYLGLDTAIHPSYIFTPSNTTYKTAHQLNYRMDQPVFRALPEEDIERVNLVLSRFGLEP